MSNLLVVYFAMLISGADGFKKDSLILNECDPNLGNLYSYEYEYMLDRGGMKVGGGGGRATVNKNCIRLAVPWLVHKDSIGVEVWQFEFDRKQNRSPKRKYVWRFMDKVIVSDALIEFPVEESGEDCSDQKKKASP